MMTDISTKAKIKKVARKTETSPQEVLQMYLFEHFLLRLSKSQYRKNFILKGGGLKNILQNLKLTFKYINL